MKTYENLTTYNPGEIEGKWYSYWENQGYFHEEVDTNKEPFSIVLPPPNVTGMLHMGHALDNTLQDILIRFKRMQGYNVLWMPGTDHAGIATQIKVEEMLAKEEGKSSQLELTFYIANELGNYIYVGYENAKGEVTYPDLTALHPVKYSEALRVTIPRTEYLYLVDTQMAEYIQQFMEHQSNAKVKVEKFAIGKQTNALKINYLSHPHNMLEEVDFVYDAPTQSLIVADEHIDSIALFKKKNKATSSQFPLVSINPLPNWQQQLH